MSTRTRTGIYKAIGVFLLALPCIWVVSVIGLHPLFGAIVVWVVVILAPAVLRRIKKGSINAK